MLEATAPPMTIAGDFVVYFVFPVMVILAGSLIAFGVWMVKSINVLNAQAMEVRVDVSGVKDDVKDLKNDVREVRRGQRTIARQVGVSPGNIDPSPT